jgi:signal transduction histidine kinase
VQFFISVQFDVTARIEAEEKLRQTMKMEALGQLTGGVAQDFNNILTVITGTIEILADGVSDRPKLGAIAQMISEAAERAASSPAGCWRSRASNLCSHAKPTVMP